MNEHCKIVILFAGHMLLNQPIKLPENIHELNNNV